MASLKRTDQWMEQILGLWSVYLSMNTYRPPLESMLNYVYLCVCGVTGGVCRRDLCCLYVYLWCNRWCSLQESMSKCLQTSVFVRSWCDSLLFVAGVHVEPPADLRGGRGPRLAAATGRKTDRSRPATGGTRQPVQLIPPLRPACVSPVVRAVQTGASPAHSTELVHRFQ